MLHGTSTPAVLGLEETVPSSSVDDCNFLNGDAGDDSISGGHGHHGARRRGEGPDRQLRGRRPGRPGLGDDTVHGPRATYGTTTVTYAERAEAATVTFGHSIAGRGGAAGERDVLEKVAGVIGGAGDDRLTGSAGYERLAGGPGSDVFDAGGGADLTGCEEERL